MCVFQLDMFEYDTDYIHVTHITHKKIMIRFSKSDVSKAKFLVNIFFCKMFLIFLTCFNIPFLPRINFFSQYCFCKKLLSHYFFLIFTMLTPAAALMTNGQHLRHRRGWMHNLIEYHPSSLSVKRAIILNTQTAQVPRDLMGSWK